MKSFLVLLLFTLCMPLAGQTPTFDEIEFEPDSITAPYKATGRNYIFLRSKKGTGGMAKTPTADALLSAEVTEIVLVFSETDAGDLAEREEANRERWENLLNTYPEFFQFSTTYKNLCQCKVGGDAEAFKQVQGFYVYINGEVPKVVETKTEEPKAVATAPVTPVKTEEKKPEKTEEKTVKAPEKEAATKDVAVTDKTEVKTKEAPPVVNEPVTEKKAAAKENEKQSTTSESSKSNNTSSAPVARASSKKTSGAAKPRKAKDPKACRVACYQNGDEELNAFFKDNIQMSRKERRKAKKLTPVIKLQLDVDGSVKKALVTCPDEKFNVKITDAVKSMNPWNASVKGGKTVKSEVKITLKFDKKAKAFKTSEVAVTPRLGAKCKCVSDAELFD